MDRAPPNRWLALASLSLIYFVISAGAFSSLGVALPAMVTELKWDWKAAEEEFHQGLTAAPNNADVLIGAGTIAIQ